VNTSTDSTNFREAIVKDIPALHTLRMSVKENVLNNPLLVTEIDYVNFLTKSGKGWLCEVNNQVVGFAIIDTDQNNIWALFILPEFEGKGIGKRLHDMMLDWHFNQNQHKLWLGTAPNTRAEQFYTAAGWKAVGRRENGEIRFEMRYEVWKDRLQASGRKLQA
jgi:GNAT superfamily N-acetyltransferase